MANQYMQEEDDAILKTYNRYPVVLDHGDGAYHGGNGRQEFTAGRSGWARGPGTQKTENRG